MERKRLLVAVLVILALIAVGVNYKSLELAWRSHKYKQSHHEVSSPKPNLEPIGSPEAKVKIRVLIDPEVECQWVTFFGVRKVAEKYKDRVYVEFPAANEPPEKLHEETLRAGGGCAAAITINGRTDFKLKYKGEDYKIILSGPLSTAAMMMPTHKLSEMQKHPPGHGYTIYELELIIRDLIRKEYGVDPEKEYGPIDESTMTLGKPAEPQQEGGE